MAEFITIIKSNVVATPKEKEEVKTDKENT